jgi:hypothetical protein
LIKKTAKHEWTLWVPETPRTSCGLLIFVEEAAEAVVSLDLADLGRRTVGEWA